MFFFLFWRWRKMLVSQRSELAAREAERLARGALGRKAREEQRERGDVLGTLEPFQRVIAQDLRDTGLGDARIDRTRYEFVDQNVAFAKLFGEALCPIPEPTTITFPRPRCWR